ncbi:STAS domain-containing protein [Aquibacillus salsiterrae]|uniref:STAS domain-containing protein n=1 Tax=Aquibacillus salsiterrae TaxID=2950439 RepID=A0A9X3WD44_9BACI|nr:STAS domain-containing protein [Aquibacillus salsiterrae]MDC3417662.1 STAS domain-containing protein [Aquibacillus salsiterrae]
MKEELEFIGKRIVANKEKLTGLTLDMQNSEYTEHLNRSSISQDVVFQGRTELFHILGESLYSEFEESMEKLRKWANQMGTIANDNGISLDRSIKSLAIYRDIIWDTFSEEIREEKFAAITVLDVNKIIDPLIDEANYIFTQIFAENNKQMIEVAQNTLQQLSVPVVPLSKDIAVLPLIGEIDTYRSKLIMETALAQSTALKLNYMLIDVSGVPIVDTVVAHNLFQVVNALRLIGVEAIITGIRPEIAHTVVSLGIEFGGVKTLANLAQALSEIGFKQTTN